MTSEQDKDDGSTQDGSTKDGTSKDGTSKDGTGKDGTGKDGTPKAPPVQDLSDPSPPGSYLTVGHAVAASAGAIVGLVAVTLWRRYCCPPDPIAD